MRVCPFCGQPYSEYPALSRTDNKTEICSDCGTLEALADFFRIPFENVDFRTGEVKENE